MGTDKMSTIKSFKVGEAPWEIKDESFPKSFKIGSAPWEKPESIPESPSVIDSGIRQLAQEASLGMSDELAGGFEATGKALGLKGLGGAIKDIERDPNGMTFNMDDLKKAYLKGRDQERKNLSIDFEENPTTSALAGLTGAIVSPLNKVANGMSLLKGGAILGGVTGLGHSKAQNATGMALDTAGSALIGGSIGKAFDAASPLVQKGFSKLSSGSKDLAERFAGRALGAERATIKKLGPDKIKELGRYALDEKILSPFASTDDLIERNLLKRADGASKMNEVYTAIDDAGASTFSPLEAATQVDEKIGGFYRSPINRAETNQLENTLESILIRGENYIPLSKAQTLKQELGKVANWENRLNITDKERMAREAYGVISNIIDETTEKGAKIIGKDGLNQILGEGKRLYGLSKGADALLNNKYAAEQGNRLVGLTDTIAGAGALGAGGAGLAGVPGAAGVVLAKKGFDRYGSQISALGLDGLADILMKAPKLAARVESNPAAVSSVADKIKTGIIPPFEIPKAAPLEDREVASNNSKIPDMSMLAQQKQEPLLQGFPVSATQVIPAEQTMLHDKEISANPNLTNIQKAKRLNLLRKHGRIYLGNNQQQN